MKLPPGYVPGSGAQKATAYGGFGEKLMKHMGWEDGQGLGRDKQGMRKAIEVKLKEDTVGVRLASCPYCQNRTTLAVVKHRGGVQICRLEASPHMHGRRSGGRTPSTPEHRQSR